MSLKSKIILSFIIFSISNFCSKTASAQRWSWVVNATGSSQYSDSDRDIAVDNNGNQFIAGYFTKTLTLGSITLNSPDDYYSDMFLAKIDSSGLVIWAKAFDLGTTYNEAVGICLDDSNNIYLTAARNGKLFVSKFDSTGALQWDSNISGKNIYGYGRDIALDQFENVFITGNEGGSSIVAKLNRNGSYLWSSIVKGCHSNGAWGNDLAVDRLGNCYMAGGFDCDSVQVGHTILRRVNDWGARTFLVKYSSNGEVMWVNMPDGRTNSIPQVALTDSGSVILAGSFDFQLTFNNQITVPPYIYGLSSFIAKYNTEGNLIWARNGTKYESIPRDMITDVDGNIYLGGTRFGNWGGTEMDFHLIKYNPAGDTIYTRDVLPGHEYLYGLDIDNFGNTYLVGHANVQGLGVIGTGYTNPYSVYAAKFNTGSKTRRRPNKPFIEKTFIVCAGNNAPALFAPGANVRWYKDGLLENLLSSGNSYTPNFTKTDTLYVTQTVDNIQSWPKQVIIYFSTLSDFSIEHKGDSLFAPASGNYTYQWYWDSTAIIEADGGNQPVIKPINHGIYKVLINDMSCTKEASYFYSEPSAGYLNFSAIKDGSSAILKWEITKDTAIKNFELQKGNDGILYTKLAYIARIDRATTKFAYTDTDLWEGLNYYRLKVFWEDGRITYSDVISLTSKREMPLRVSPNPIIGNELRFSFTGEQLPAICRIRIFGANGNLLYYSLVNINNNEIKVLNINFLKAGTYFLELFDGKDKTTCLFIKN